MHKGETPITKNIRVIDSKGNQYEATYPKRAKGLVKHGRARFIDEHTLCLACPPNDNLEDKSMNNQQDNNREWLQRIDIASIAEHMDSSDIVELIKVLPEDVLKRVDYSEIVSHMDSDDIIELVQSLPAEQLKRLDIATIVENMDSSDIVEFMKKLLRNN